tara:strand:+ start:519 stop:686 length:168 start_codon:yes stop_codon:yes gene_type:complete
MSIKPHQLFNTPDDWDTITAWIDAHPKGDRIHLWTAAGMAWNLAAKLSTKETINA